MTNTNIGEDPFARFTFHVLNHSISTSSISLILVKFYSQSSPQFWLKYLTTPYFNPALNPSHNLHFPPAQHWSKTNHFDSQAPTGRVPSRRGLLPHPAPVRPPVRPLLRGPLHRQAATGVLGASRLVPTVALELLTALSWMLESPRVSLNFGIILTSYAAFFWCYWGRRGFEISFRLFGSPFFSPSRA